MLKGMKKFALSVVLMAIGLSLQAQPEPGTWTITPRIGVNSSNVSGVKIYYADPQGAAYYPDAYYHPGVSVKSKHKWGLTAGADVEYQIHRSLAMSLGVFYSDEGFRVEHGAIEEYKEYDENIAYYVSQPGFKLKWNLRYVNVPLLAHFYIEPNMLPGLSLKAGVQFGFFVKNNYSAEYLNDSHTKASGEIKYDRARLNISIPAGISYSYRNFVADLRYNIGVTNIKKEVIEESSCHSNSIQLTIGYQFRL